MDGVKMSQMNVSYPDKAKTGTPIFKQEPIGIDPNFVFKDEIVSVREWLLTFLISVIPIVNLVMMFVWAFSDKVKKSKSNYFKAMLIFSAIMVVLSLIFYAVLLMFFAAIFSQVPISR
jgi:hypothetical protein